MAASISIPNVLGFGLAAAFIAIFLILCFMRR